MVISGDLKNLIGRVERVAEGVKVDVMPKMEGLTDILTFEITQLEKYFEVRHSRAGYWKVGEADDRETI